MLAQSQALTALVAQLAGNDSMLDMGLSTGSSTSVRSAGQRARMQEELASGKGIFFQQVLQNMSRRMAPAASSSSDPAQLLQQGITLTRCWERFGGFSQSKDLGLVAFQVGMIMDALQAGNTGQAQDHTALLAVCLEQAALDSGASTLATYLPGSKSLQ